MKLPSWLRFGETPAPAPAPQRAPDLTEYGASGTPIFGGFLRDAGEYNPELTGIAAFRIYEKMRRSDSQVAATLMGMKLAIRSAEWTVAVDDDASPVEQEACDFVRDCLMEELDFDQIIENALLMLDFGCSVHEDVWYVDGNRVRLRKLAPRLPLTFYRWLTEPNGEDLIALQQMGYRGGNFITVDVPIEKMALFTFQQEGSNFAGRSVLRPMYQHWYIKSALYKVDAIACERNGMGVPWAKMAENAKTEDRATAIAWLEKLAAHQSAAIVIPPGWEWGLRGVEGTLRDPKESIHHHNVAISMAGLAQFMMLGQSQSGGNRALGQTMSDLFYMGLQATANRIARVLSLTTVQRLVDFNFSGLEKYPRIVPQNILALQFEALVAALQSLSTSNVVTPDDELEAWLRKKMGAPEPGTPRNKITPTPTSGTAVAVPPASPSGTGPGEAGTSAASPATEKNLPRPSAKEPPVDTAPADKVAGSEAAPAPAGMGDASASPVPTRREPRGAERCLALAEIICVLDSGRDDIAAALRAARSRIQAEIVNKLVNTPVRNMHRASLAPDEKLIAEVEAILERVYTFGSDQVGQERDRQRAGKAPSDAGVLRAAEGKGKKRDPLGVYADGVVAEYQNTLTSRAANVTLDWMRRPGDLTKGEIIRKVEEDLDAQSDRWIDGPAAKGANEAFADGRGDGYEAYKDEISEVQYSALLDLNTCEACAAADGEAGPTPDDIPAVPNPDCDGGDKCRCVHVFVFSDEVRGK